MFTMRVILFAFFAALVVGFAQAQSAAKGRIILNAPTFVTTCASTNIRWYWTGTDAEASALQVTIQVASLQSMSRRSLGERGSNDRFIKRRIDTATHTLQKRLITINIAGASNIPLSAMQWMWPSVDLHPGSYRVALTIQGGGATTYSDDFTVTTGTDTSCLTDVSTISSATDDASASTSAVDETSTTAPASTTSEAGTPTSQTSAPASSNTSAAEFGSDSNSSAAAQDQDQHDSSNTGKIVAGVAVPVVAILAVIAIFFCCRKRQADNAQTRRNAWSEKAVAMLDRSNSTSSAAQGLHQRNISEPFGPTHEAGLADHESYIRNDMHEGRYPAENMSTPRNGPAAPGAYVSNETQSDPRWVHFNGGEHDAHPLSPTGMQAIVRQSTESSRQPVGDFYKHGNNRNLDGTVDSHRFTASTNSNGSSLPPYLRGYASSVPSFGHDARGQPLQGGEVKEAHPTTAEHVLQRNTSESSHGSGQGGAAADGLERKGSGLRRKPVPHLSTSTEGTAVGVQGPFADQNAAPGAGQASMPIPASQEARSSAQTGHTIPDERMQQMLQSSHESQMSQQQAYNGTSPAYNTTAGHNGESPASLNLPLPGRSLTGPRSVGGSEQGSPFISDAQNEAWKLSVQLGAEDDRGFRVSFPDAQSIRGQARPQAF